MKNILGEKNKKVHENIVRHQRAIDELLKIYRELCEVGVSKEGK